MQDLARNIARDECKHSARRHHMHLKPTAGAIDARVMAAESDFVTVQKYPP